MLKTTKASKPEDWKIPRMNKGRSFERTALRIMNKT
jgi:hypothetical protein